jgi:transposase
MAYLKKEKKSSGTYLKIVESYRNKDGSPRQKTLYNIGKAENFSNSTLKNIANVFLQLAGEKPNKSIRELKRYNYGFHLVYNRIMKHYGLDKILNNIKKRHHLEYDLYKTILLMLIERLNDPGSKLSNFNHQNEYIGYSNIDLHYLYRALDRLEESNQIIQEQIYRKGLNLFNQKLDVVFYDVTTFYFDSDKEDDFRKIGYNKDGKIGKTVVVFGMLIDKENNPIGYKVYRGGFYEGHTFGDAITTLKQEYEIEKVITVADRGMMNSENIKIVEEEAQYDYIIGERLKNLPEAIQNKITDLSTFKELRVNDDSSGQEITIQYKLIDYNGKRLISTYSEKRARKDRYDREKRVEQGEKILNQASIIEKKARRNYLKKTGENKYVIDEGKIRKDAKYDGIACIATNNKELSTAEVLSAYKQLYKIEHTFRTFKRYLETRPMFHWTEKRIEGHLCLCYIAYTLLNYLLRQLLKNGKQQSENKIRENLCKMQLSKIEDNGREFYLRSYLNDGMKDILKSLGIRRLPDVIKSDAINDYIS